MYRVIIDLPLSGSKKHKTIVIKSHKWPARGAVTVSGVLAEKLHSATTKARSTN